ncbi:MAG: AAA family ATPase [Candidatus Nezhaarchaeales archaeon]
MMIGSGCTSIDKSLGGGFKTGEVTLIYGDAGVGKTTLALQCAFNTVSKSFKVIYVYTDGGADLRQVKRIWTGSLKEFKEFFFLFEPKDFDGQEQLVYMLEKIPLRRFKLIVFDTITSLYRLSLIEDNSIILSKRLNQQLAILSWLALNNDLCVLITSRVRLSSGIEEPIATSILEYWVKTMVKIERINVRGYRRVSVEKLNGKPCSNIIEVELMDGGFR